MKKIFILFYIFIILLGLLGNIGFFFGYIYFNKPVASNEIEETNYNFNISINEEFYNKNMTNSSIFNVETTDLKLNSSNEIFAFEDFGIKLCEKNQDVNQTNSSTVLPMFDNQFFCNYTCLEEDLNEINSFINKTITEMQNEHVLNSEKKYFYGGSRQQIYSYIEKIVYEDDIVIITCKNLVDCQIFYNIISLIDKAIQKMDKCKNVDFFIEQFRQSKLINEILLHNLHEKDKDSQLIEIQRLKDEKYFAKMFFYANQYKRKIKMKFKLNVIMNKKLNSSYLYRSIIYFDESKYYKYNETTRNYLKMSKDIKKQEKKLIHTTLID